MAKIDTWIDLANLYYQAGALDKAIAAYLNIIKQGCRFGNVYNNLASAYASQGSIREAIPHYQRCIELLSDPKERANVSIRLGECHRQLGDYDSAITAFKKAYELDPGNLAVMKGLGILQSDLEAQAQSEEPDSETSNQAIITTRVLNTFDPALSGDLPLTIPGKSLAAVQVDESVNIGVSGPDGQLPFASELSANPITSPEQDDSVRATLLLTVGIMHWRNGRLDESVNILESAIDICAKIQNNWTQALCWHALALVKTDLGNVESAIGAYRQAVSLAPDQIFPWSNVGNLYNSMGRNDEAMLAFHRAIKQNPEDTKSWDGLGDIYTKLGRLDDGIAAYQLGNIFEKRPQGPDAIKAYEKAFQLYKLTISAFTSPLSVDQPDSGFQPLDELPEAVVSPAENLAPLSAAAPAESDSGEQAVLNQAESDQAEPEQAVLDQAVLTQDPAPEPETDFSFQPENMLIEQPDEMQAILSAPVEVTPEEPEPAHSEPVELPGDAPMLAEQLTLATQPAPVETSSRAPGTVSDNPGTLSEADLISRNIVGKLKIVEMNPDDHRAWDSLGNLYRITHRIPEAIYAFEKAVMLMPNYHLYRYQLGTCYAANGDYQAAIREIGKTLELNQTYVAAHCALASYYRKLGNKEETQKHITQAAPFMSKYKEYDRACFESIRGNVSEALELLKLALEKKQTTVEWIRRDLDFDFIRSDPRFEKLAYGNTHSLAEYENSKHY